MKRSKCGLTPPYLDLQILGALVSALRQVNEVQLVVIDTQFSEGREDPLRAGRVRSSVHNERHGAARSERVKEELRSLQGSEMRIESCGDEGEMVWMNWISVGDFIAGIVENWRSGGEVRAQLPLSGRNRTAGQRGPSLRGVSTVA